MTTTPVHGFDVGGVERCPFMPVFGPPALSIERGSGTEVWDTAGHRYLDFLSGIAVTSLGHANPVVAEAIARQAATLLHVSNFFANPVATGAAIDLVELLRESTGAVGQVFFTNSGAESNECAIKLARRFGGPDRYTVVTALGSFHGRTLATLAATGQPAKHAPFAPMPDGFRHVPWADLDAVRSVVDEGVAAVMIESVQGEGGVHPAPAGYLAGLRRLCDDAGALLIVDEIQTGFARTGRWFGFEHDGVVPDVVTMAKAMGNGMPVGACWARTEVAAAFRPGDHGSTYSGTALATAAVSAGVAALRRVAAPALATARGERFGALLAAIPGVSSVRGRGLLIGAELTAGIAAADAYRALLEHGLICNAVTASTLRFAPPITVSDDELDEAAAIVRSVLAGLAS
ncbi:MAG: aspartate aminotransferase family protein [Ilumatobacteraceae bacterium]